MVKFDNFGDVVNTTEGPLCGSCAKETGKRGQHRHADVASIKACHTVTAQRAERIARRKAAQSAWVAYLPAMDDNAAEFELAASQI